MTHCIHYTQRISSLSQPSVYLGALLVHTWGVPNDAGTTGNSAPPEIRHGIPLSAMTTLELGGPANHTVAADRLSTAIEAIRWARREGCSLAVMGGGSNVVAADEGWDGLILQPVLRGFDLRRDGGLARLTVAAGEPWDDVVALTVDEGLAGLECLAGIPGWAGATPIQNVGAYGQQVAEVIESVEVLDLETLDVSRLSAAGCRFSYRGSLFRTFPDRYLVLSVDFILRPGGEARLHYDELVKTLDVRGATPTLGEVRKAVLDLRKAKSMVLDPNDANRRSVGSFFLNPILEDRAVAGLRNRSVAAGVVDSGEVIPTFPAASGQVKVPAAWLVEKAGFAKGLRRGAVGISSRHALALIHYGGGTSQALVTLAREIRAAVGECFGVLLEPEPVFLGFGTRNPVTEE
jgi:UDP-N-acetylmuramate dehydrogenase